MDKKTTKISLDFFSIKKVGGDVYIEGWANKAVVDRGKDLIQMDAWKLDNFKKNPMILFNHDPSKPIGKAVDVRATDAGLWIKAKLSRSKDPEISRIRDLVQEGILNTFSVGFDCQDEEKSEDGVNNIKDAELYEVSIVTLPMNQDSIFSVSAKSLASLTREEAISKILKEKGACVAEAVHDKIFKDVQAGAKRNDLLKAISDHASASLEDLAQILAGNINPVPKEVLGAFAEVLKMNLKELEDMNDGEKVEEEEKDKKAQLGVAVIGIKVPKDMAESAEQAASMVSEAGYDASNVEEKEDGYFFVQNDPAKFVEGKESQIDLGGGVMAVIGVLKPEGTDDSEGTDTNEEPPAEDETKTEETDETKAAENPPIPGSTDGTITGENPALEQAKQTNILLGVLIEAVKGMSEKLDKISVESVDDIHEESIDEEETVDEQETEEEKKAAMSRFQKYLVELNDKLKKLGA